MGFCTKKKDSAKQGWFFALLLLPLMAVLACGGAAQRGNSNAAETIGDGDIAIRTGAEQLDRYLPLLAGKKVGMMGNQTSVVGDRHLVDVLLEEGVDLQFAFEIGSASCRARGCQYV